MKKLFFFNFKKYLLLNNKLKNTKIMLTALKITLVVSVTLAFIVIASEIKKFKKEINGKN